MSGIIPTPTLYLKSFSYSTMACTRAALHFTVTNLNKINVKMVFTVHLAFSNGVTVVQPIHCTFRWCHKGTEQSGHGVNLTAVAFA